MSGSLMDTNPPSPVVPEPESPKASVSAEHPATSMAVAASRRESPLLEIFVGPNGLYPGTRWLIYLALGFLIALIFLTGMRIVHPHSGGSVAWMMLAQVIVMLAAILPALVMTHLEDRPFGDFGLPLRNAFGRNFWIGAVSGIASLSGLLLVIYFAGGFSFGSVALHGTGILKYAIFYAVFFLFTGFFEDFLFRGYSQWVLSKGMHFWPAAAFLSVCFGAIHSTNAGESKAGLIAAGMIGFFFCLTLRRTGDLWWAIGFHMSWDWGESYLFSVPDSGGMMTGHLLNSSFHGPAWLTGGTVGPEGSLIVFIVIPVVWVLFDRMYPDVKYDH
jgi:membrane protease YdiL (CAAX protease family)